MDAVKLRILCDIAEGAGGGGGGGSGPFSLTPGEQSDYDALWSASSLEISGLDALGTTSLDITVPILGGIVIESFANLLSITSSSLVQSNNFTIQNNPLLQTVSLSAFVGLAIRDFSIVASPFLASLSLPVFANVFGFTLVGPTALTSLSLPALSTISDNIQIFDHPLLTTLSIPSVVFTNNKTYYFVNNAFPAAMVNSLLAQAVSNAGFTTGIFDLSGAGNAAPTGQGIIDKGVLLGRGVTLTTN